MQFIEASIIGLRSAVITLKSRASPLKFTLFPMVHVGERAFYDEVAARAGQCQLIVAEGVPSRFAPAQLWMSRIRRDHLVDQTDALDLEALGVPVRWEEPEIAASSERSFRDKVVDPVAAVALRLLGRYGGALDVPSVEQTDAQDFDWADAAGRIERFFLYNVVHLRDEKLTRALGEIHRDMSAEPATVAVVYGAVHMIAVADYLIGTLHYYVGDAEWLMVANAPS